MRGSSITSILCSDPEIVRSALANGPSGDVASLDVRCSALLPNIVAARVLDACSDQIDDTLLQRFSGALGRFQAAYDVRSAKPEFGEAEGLQENQTPFRFPVAKDQEYLTANLALLVSDVLNRVSDARALLVVKIRNSRAIDDYSMVFMRTLTRLSDRIGFIFDEDTDLLDAERVRPPPEDGDFPSGSPLIHLQDETRLLNNRVRDALSRISSLAPEPNVAAVSALVEYSRLLSNAGYYSAALATLEPVSLMTSAAHDPVWPVFSQTAFTSYCCLSEGARALDIAKSQLQYAELHGIKLEAAKAFHNTATVYLRLFDDSYLDLAGASIARAEEILVSQNHLSTLLGVFVLNTHALFNLRCGHLYDALKRLNQAIEMCSALSSYDPRSKIEHGTLLFNKFQLLQKMGQSEEALEYVRRAIQVEPRNMAFLHAQGNALAATGQLESAVLSLEMARDCGYYTPDLLLSLSFAQESAGMFKECLETLTRLRELYPENLAGFLDACRILREEEETPEDALPIVETALQHHPRNPDVWEECANIHHDLGDVIAAEHAYNKAILLDSTQLGSIIGLAVLYNENGRFKECRDYLLKALEVSPTDETALENLNVLEGHWSA